MTYGAAHSAPSVCGRLVKLLVACASRRGARRHALLDAECLTAA